MPSRARSWRRTGGRILLVLLGLSLPLLVGELYLRAAWQDESAAKPPAPEGLSELETLADISRPGVRGFHEGVFFRTNSVGMRGPEYSLEPAPGVFRIVVVGDSVTMGSGVLEEQAYPARLQALLNGAGGERSYEVLNLGLSGLNLAGVVKRLERIGLTHSPHLVVYGFTINDIEGPAYRKTTGGPLGRARIASMLRFHDSPSRLADYLWPRIFAFWERFRPAPGSLVYDVRENYFNNPEAWTTFVRGLDRLRDIGDDRDLCMHVLLHAHLSHMGLFYPFQAAYERVAAAARERGLSVTESYPYFRDLADMEARLGLLDAHPNPLGHARLAQALHEGVRGIPDPCWQGPGARREPRT